MAGWAGDKFGGLTALENKFCKLFDKYNTPWYNTLKKDLNMKLMVFDTETADKLENTDKSIMAEIGYMFYDSSKNFFFFESEYVKPEIPMSPGASAVNNITNVDVGIEPDINGNIKNIPVALESKVFKRFMGGVKKYENYENFYITGYNIDNFDIEVINRAAKNNLFEKVKRIDLYRIAKYLYFTDEGRKIVREDFNPEECLPDSISLQYLKHFYKLYHNKEKLKQNNIIGEKYSNLFNKPHGAFSDVVDTFVLFKFFEENFNLSPEKMRKISNKPIILDYFHYGFQRGERISATGTIKLLNTLGRTDDRDLGETIIKELLVNRRESVDAVYKAGGKLFEDIIKSVLKNNNIFRKKETKEKIPSLF